MNDSIRTLAFVGAFTLPALLLPTAAQGSDDDDQTPVATVTQVDLSRYVGLWYEIARIPNRFQKQCARGTTAEYALREDGRLDVVNRCVERDGDADEARGIARIIENSGNARLQVSFVSFLGWRPFWGDYWVMGLDPDYQWAAIGHPGRKFGWILARTPTVDEATLEEIFVIVERNGYRRDVFEMSRP